ncbi:MAG TPA: hypothetical protein GXX51_00620 [Firmicutes bacterium]|nr:hypothetical protein [Bacillota bacterium]
MKHLRIQMVAVSQNELRLLTELRKIPYGEALVIMRDGQPRRIERLKESITLDDQEETH